MSTMLVVMTYIEGRMREGLLECSRGLSVTRAGAASSTAAASSRGWQHDPLARLDRVGALLDVIGRSAEKPPGRMIVDVEAHGSALLEALDCGVRVLERLVGEARAPPRSPWIPAARWQARVLHGFTRTVAERLMAAPRHYGRYAAVGRAFRLVRGGCRGGRARFVGSYSWGWVGFGAAARLGLVLGVASAYRCRGVLPARAGKMTARWVPVRPLPAARLRGSR